MTLTRLLSSNDAYFALLRDDPVRPFIPHDQRIGTNRDVFVLERPHPAAVICVSYLGHVPSTESELFVECLSPDTAVFYTVWSYKPGAGRDIILEVSKYIRESMPHITRFVTLSPHTELARRFHLKNGATEFRMNTETVNFEYVFKD